MNELSDMLKKCEWLRKEGKLDNFDAEASRYLSGCHENGLALGPESKKRIEEIYWRHFA